MSSLNPIPALSERRTASDEVADTLREAIISGHFEDGQELNQVELAKHFGVSRVPVREALRHLEAEGLVTAEAHRRVVVPGLDPARISEILEIRALIEAYLLECAAPNLDAEDFAALHRVLASSRRARSREVWLTRNSEFHHLLLRRANRPEATLIVERLSHQVERYLRRTGGVQRTEDAGAEHEQILDALERNATKQAVKLLRAHILSTRDAVVATVTKKR